LIKSRLGGAEKSFGGTGGSGLQPSGTCADAAPAARKPQKMSAQARIRTPRMPYGRPPVTDFLRLSPFDRCPHIRTGADWRREQFAWLPQAHQRKLHVCRFESEERTHLIIRHRGQEPHAHPRTAIRGTIQLRKIEHIYAKHSSKLARRKRR